MGDVDHEIRYRLEGRAITIRVLVSHHERRWCARVITYEPADDGDMSSMYMTAPVGSVDEALALVEPWLRSRYPGAVLVRDSS